MIQCITTPAKAADLRKRHQWLTLLPTNVWVGIVRSVKLFHKQYCERQLGEKTVANNKLQMAMFPPKSDWLPPEHPFPEDILDAKEIAIDVETRDPDLKTKGPGWPTKNGEVVGYAIAIPGWKGYFPVNHLGGGNIDTRQLNKWLKKVFECPADKIMHNAQYDLGWIRAMALR